MKIREGIYKSNEVVSTIKRDCTVLHRKVLKSVTLDNLQGGKVSCSTQLLHGEDGGVSEIVCSCRPLFICI